ncbi:MAG: radical SAM protein [Xanthomonadales bacterium]|jgi:MoaA/NifB/PqqE/SkfB family radical SAM enzyme|nr:radical SAM protein [Xanthomonadales bacterium]
MNHNEAAEHRSVYLETKARKVTRRGILWLGQTCNLRCHFCYFLDRITDDSHPEHGFMGLDKAKAICKTLVDYYGNNSIDIQGGEPTLYPPIYDLVAYCAEIGLSPTLITNAIALSRYENAVHFKKVGIRDFLISVQGLGDVYDKIVGRPGGHAWQMKALDNLQKVGIPFRFNTVLSKLALPQLMDISKLAVDTGAGVVNFLGFNPFNDQTTGKRSADNVPSYREVRGPLEQAIGYLLEQNVEVNVRYLPQCLVPDDMRNTSYGFKQLPYDLHENDYASWSWTDLPAQRTAGMALTPPFKLGKRLELGAMRGPLRMLDRNYPKLGKQLHLIKQGLERQWAGKLDDHADSFKLETLYQKDAEVRSKEYTGYHHVEACKDCSLRSICDGVYGDYAEIFGVEGLRPVQLDSAVTDVQHYTRQQYKVVHPLDRDWLESGDQPVAAAVMEKLARAR